MYEGNNIILQVKYSIHIVNKQFYEDNINHRSNFRHR